MIQEQSMKKFGKAATKLSERVKVITDEINVSCNCDQSKATKVAVHSYMTTIHHSLIRIFDVLEHHNNSHPDDGVRH